MKIVFTTNIDAYGRVKFPEISFVPRAGELVHVKKDWENYCDSEKIPNRLEVVRVSYKEDYVEVELWFNSTDYKIYTESGHKLL